MNLLIDSSTNYLFLAIENKGEYKHFIRYGKCDHSETMVDYLDEFIKENGFTYNDIENVYIGRGPGSYTGLRIAGVIGKVLTYIKKIKFYSFSSLDVSLASVYGIDGKYISITPAKKNYSYAKIFEFNNGKLTVIEDDYFVENSALEAYKDYQVLEINEDLLNTDKIAKEILINKLYEEEDSLEYSPNYLRSGI